VSVDVLADRSHIGTLVLELLRHSRIYFSDCNEHIFSDISSSVLLEHILGHNLPLELLDVHVIARVSPDTPERPVEVLALDSS